jgi:Tfp pilus assembly protein PilF
LARAWTLLARVRNLQAGSGYIPLGEGYEKGKKDVEKALELDPNLADAHEAMGLIKTTYEWDWTGADAAYKRALQLEPANAVVVGGAATLAASLGRFDEAMALARQSIELDPLRVAGHFNLSFNAYYAGKLQEAEAAARKALELNPQYPVGRWLLVRICLAQGKAEEALAEIQKEPEPLWRGLGLALAYHAAGKKKEADAALADFVGKYHDDSAFQIAEVYAYRGEIDNAFEWLERAYKQRDAGLAEMKGDPLLRNLERDPRYKAFLKKLNLPLD